jgi:chromosome segregation ATPase
VGHATTGKSGRVIHNLQEDIARLTRELTLYRSRADEAQHLKETLKEQIINMAERLRNSEQSNETNLSSIYRKDRKIEEFRLEIETQRIRRQKAEAETGKANQLMSEEREEFHRKCAELQEITNHATTQYDALAKVLLRDKADLQKKFKGVRDELYALRREAEKKDKEQERLDALIDRQNQELEAERNRIGGILQAYEAYKTQRDREIRDLIEKGHENESTIDTALISLKETEDKLKWTIQMKKEISWAE